MWFAEIIKLNNLKRQAPHACYFQALEFEDKLMNKNTIKRNLLIISLFSITIFLLLPVQASADAGVPMIFLSFPLMLISLIPIIFIESYIYTKTTSSPFKRSIAASATANSISTIAGFPLAWGLLFGLELLTTGGSCGPGFDTVPKSILTAILESAWLCPWEDQLYWLIPIAFINSLIVAFFISVLIEYFILKKFMKDTDRKVVKKATYIANISSYLLLILMGLGYLIYSVITYR